MAVIITNTDNGKTVDITDAVDDATETATAFTNLVDARVAETGEARDDVVEALTANYTRAACEEDSHNALRTLLAAFEPILD